MPLTEIPDGRHSKRHDQHPAVSLRPEKDWTAFLLGSLYSTVLTSVFLDLFAGILPVPAVRPLVAALFGGVFMGVSLDSCSSATPRRAGVDIVARLIEAEIPQFPHRQDHPSAWILTIAVITGVVYRDFNNTL